MFLFLRVRYKILCVLMLLLGFNMQVKSDNVTIRLDPSQSFQTVEGIGGGIVYYLDWVTTHKNKQAVYDTVFSGLGISGLRIANWAQEDSADLKHEKEIMAEAKKRLGNKFFTLMSCWSAPAYLKANNSLRGTGAGTVKASLKKQNGRFMYDEYGHWWRKSIERYNAVGIYPDYVSIQNEPDMDATYEATLFNPTESWDVASYGSALSAVANHLSGLTPCPKLIGPEVMGIGWQQTQKYIWELDQRHLGGYAFHYYHSGLNDHDALDMRYSYPDDYTEAMKGLFADFGYDKPMFMTENSSLRDRQQNDPIYMAWFISKAFNDNKAASYLHWNLLWGNEGDGCINLDFDEKGYSSESGYIVQGDYHALRHYSKYVGRGWKVISSSSSHWDILSTAFKSPSDDAYTIVIVNKGAYWHNVSHNLSLTGYQVEVVQSVPANGIWSSPVTDFWNGLNVAPNSIVTIAYRKNPELCIWGDNGSGNWLDATKWRNGKVPSETDIVRIDSAVCDAAELYQTSEVFVREGAELRVDEISVLKDLKISKGKLTHNNGSYHISVWGTLTSIDTTVIFVDEDSRSLLLSGTLKGEGDILKKGTGSLKVESSSEEFYGTWYVEEGRLENGRKNAFGRRPIYISSRGSLAVMYEDSVVSLEVEDGGVVYLSSDLRVREAIVGGAVLSNGVYTSNELPGILKGEAKLIVQFAYPSLFKWGDGAISQVVMEGEKIVPFNYSYYNVSTIDVTWEPYQPKGIDVSYAGSDDDRYISISGVLKEEGFFNYSVSAIGYRDSMVVTKGYLSTPMFVGGTTNLANANSLESIDVQINSNDGICYVEFSQLMTEDIHYMLCDVLGRVISRGAMETTGNGRKFFLPVELPEKGVYLLTLSTLKGEATVRFIAEALGGNY